MSAYTATHLDDIAAEQWPYWAPIRHQLDIRTFGINAWRGASGDEVIKRHDESESGAPELYVVMSGHATFTIGTDEVDAPAGTLVYLDDVAQKRHAVAKEAGTTVLAVGGVPGTHEASAWEYFFPALPLLRIGDYDAARRTLEEGMKEKEAPVMHYQLACVEALAGNRERALDELAIAVEGSDRYREHAQTDEDLASIRDDPRFPS